MIKEDLFANVNLMIWKINDITQSINVNGDPKAITYDNWKTDIYKRQYDTLETKDSVEKPDLIAFINCMKIKRIER